MFLSNISHPTPKYTGYNPTYTLPIKAGDTVTLPKGTKVMHRGNVKTLTRSQKVVVNHVLPGSASQWAHMDSATRATFNVPDSCRRIQLPMSNPAIVWAGAGGYWSYADVNYLVPKEELPARNETGAYVAAASVMTSLMTETPVFTSLVLNMRNQVLSLAEVRSTVTAIAATGDENVRAACQMVLDACGFAS